MGFQVGPRLQATGSLGRKNRNAPEMKSGSAGFPCVVGFRCRSCLPLSPGPMRRRTPVAGGSQCASHPGADLAALERRLLLLGGGSTWEEDKKLLLSVELRHADNEAMWDQESLAGLSERSRPARGAEVAVLRVLQSDPLLPPSDGAP